VSFFPIEAWPVSSSAIRARVAAGDEIDSLVPAAVAAVIAVRDLYGRVEAREPGGMLREEQTERTTPT
jgi:hypothetical protein